jgi:adenylate kinase
LDEDREREREREKLLALDGEENNIMTVVVRSSRLWISAFRRAVSKRRDGLEVVQQQQQRASLGYAAAVREEEEDEYQEYAWANAGLEEQGRGVQWVFLGCPGVGKGTYASRLAKLLQVPHIAMGDLVRKELSYATPIAKQVCHVCLSVVFLFFLLLISRFENRRPQTP